MPRKRASTQPASLGDIHLATDPTRWELLAEAVVNGPFQAIRALEIAGRSTTFQGKDPAARDQVGRLVSAEILKRSVVGGRITYSALPKGRAIHTRVLQLQRARRLQTTAETRVFAVIARVHGEEYDSISLPPGAELELVAELRTQAHRVAGIHKIVRISAD